VCLSIHAFWGVMVCRLLHMYRRFEKLVSFSGRLYLDCLTITMEALEFFAASKNIYPATHLNLQTTSILIFIIIN